MEIVKLTKNTDIKIFEEVALLHKQSLEKTIASSLSVNKLAKVYLYLVDKQLIKMIISISNSSISGSLSYKEPKRRTSIINLIFLSIKSMTGFISHPIIWVTEFYYKIGLYKNINSKVNIITLFVKEEFQNKKIGKLLMDNIINEYKNDIKVDTRVNNKSALNFYIKNKFEIQNTNKKNIVLKRK